MDNNSKMRPRANTGRRRGSPGGKPRVMNTAHTANSGANLSSLFGAATQALTHNQSALNHADTNNQNHGDNMVNTFNLITQALTSQQDQPPAEQLAYASQYLSQHGTSGSAQVYSQGLAHAANQFQGQTAVTPDNAMQLVQSLLGGGQAPSSSQSASSAGGDLLSSLLGAQSSGGGKQNGLDVGDLLNAGMAFMNAKKQGQSNMQAAISAVISNGPLGQQSHRAQSGEVVANALIQAISGMTKK